MIKSKGKKKEHLILLGLKKKEDGYAQGERGRRKRERERKRKKQKGKDHWWKGLEQINSILLSRVESSTRFFLKKHKLIAKKYHEGSPQWNKNRFEDKEKEEEEEKKKEIRKPDRKMTDPRFKLHSTPSGLQSAQGSWNKRKY